jgi:hypothetical protein
MINNINYISNISDNNIFHIFYHIIKYYSEDYINVFILSSNINIENKWHVSHILVARVHQYLKN